MVGGARWILIGAAMMLVAGALSWSCGGGGSNDSCVQNSSGIPVGLCGTPPPPPTPVPSSSGSASPTPTETACPAPLPTTVPPSTTLQFHAVGTFSDDSTQDITNNSSTTWTTNDPSVVVANTEPAGSFFTL